jgi:hypothetical protein
MGDVVKSKDLRLWMRLKDDLVLARDRGASITTCIQEKHRKYQREEDS